MVSELNPTPTTSPPSRRRGPVEQFDINAAAPMVAWPELFAYIKREFKQGDHVAAIGPTGSGKSHVAFEVAELRSYVIVVACKPADPLIDDALKRGYWLNETDVLEVPYSDGRPLHSHVIYWPRLGARARRKIPAEKVLAAEKAHQRPRVGAALGYVRNNGHWAIVLDEGTWVCRDLGLQRDVDSALFSFRTLNSSVIILGQRPSWMGRYVLSSPTHLFLFNTNDGDDRKALGDVSGVDSKLVAAIVERLDFERHELLYIDTRRRRMFRSIAPPR